MFDSYDFVEVLYRSVSWNKRALPDNTLEMQFNKVESEIEEAKDADERQDEDGCLEEAADILIAICGIARFDWINFLNYLYTYVDGFPLAWDAVLKRALQKLDELETRKYFLIETPRGSEYQHKVLQ